MATNQSPKRRKLESTTNNSQENRSGEDSDGYVPYVPVKKRKEAELNKLLDKKLSRKADKPGSRQQHSTTTTNTSATRPSRKTRGLSNGLDGEGDDRANDDDEEEEEQQPSRSTTTLLQEAQVVKRKQAELDAFKTEAQKKIRGGTQSDRSHRGPEKEVGWCPRAG